MMPIFIKSSENSYALSIPHGALFKDLPLQGKYYANGQIMLPTSALNDGALITKIPTVLGGGEIFIRTTTGTTITIDIDDDDTIEVVLEKAKQKDSKIVNVDVYFSGRLLDLKKTIKFYDISSESILLISNRIYPIMVSTLDKKGFTIEVEKTNLVKELKSLIMKKANTGKEDGHELNNFNLYFDNKLLGEDKQLGDYQIKESSILALVRIISFNGVSTTKKSFEFMLEENLDSSEIINHIESVENTKGKVRIMHGDATIEAKHRLDEYHFKNKDTLIVAPNKWCTIF